MHWVRVMDSTFGIGLQELDFFILMYVHPETQISLPLAFFLRKRGSQADPHPLVPDLRWMEQVLQQRFGFPTPRYIIVDKCMGSLTAQAQLVKADWASQRIQTVPPVVGPESEFRRDPTLVLQASQILLQKIAADCTADEVSALSRYLSQRGRSSGESVALSATCVIPVDTAATSQSVFGEWALLHPTLVRGLAQKLHAVFVSTKAAVLTCDESAGAVDAALREVQSYSWAIADNDSDVSRCFRLLVERWIRLCYFHAKKAIREHGEYVAQAAVCVAAVRILIACHLCAATRECGIPAATYTRDIEPDIDVLSSTPKAGVDSQWALFQTKHGTCVEY